MSHGEAVIVIVFLVLISIVIVIVILLIITITNMITRVIIPILTSLRMWVSRDHLFSLGKASKVIQSHATELQNVTDMMNIFV